jgi:hypothetical protein
MEIYQSVTTRRLMHLSNFIDIAFEGKDPSDASSFDDSVTEMFHVEDDGEEAFLRAWKMPDKKIGPIQISKVILESVTADDVFLITVGFRGNDPTIVWMSPPYKMQVRT